MFIKNNFICLRSKEIKNSIHCISVKCKKLQNRNYFKEIKNKN